MTALPSSGREERMNPSRVSAAHVCAVPSTHLKVTQYFVKGI